MDQKAFQLLHDAESSWWYQGRSIIVDRVLRKYSTTDKETGIVCDAGAGYGGMLSVLRQYGKVTAQEQNKEAQASCKIRGYDEVLLSVHPEDIPHDRFTLIGAFDVLEHTADDRAFLNILHCALKDDGQLILTVPAFQFLWSEHDITHHHYRRYSRHALVKLLESNGFCVTYSGYWNMLLFIPAAIVRLLGRSGAKSLAMPHLLDRIFFSIVSFESFFIPMFRLPFGTGIVLFAQKC